MAAIELKFLFPNRDGVFATYATNLDTSVLEVKEWLIDNWPEAIDAVEGIAPFRIRLICMGKMLEDDTKSLAAYNVKIFPHPTPINVNVRPADVAQRALSAGKNKTVSGGGAAAQGGAPGSPANQEDNMACCVVS
eukprot:CAMPEP_0119480928 /NCGR_PEP_ID=MMETSP1344-20130328/9515_1 /TAXON_ID=236787 /ORGANISM="Florenciella parvula, Strain CCMP2471" /LENGTH=134 /DNA_ID=CAMNT_0007515283 /DNA_START=189 /DNA_END=593 /DNA_ORIENTATION=-